MVIGKEWHFLAKTTFLPLSPKRVKDCQAAVYCGFFQFLAKGGRFAIFLLFICKLKSRGKPWLTFRLGKVKMPLFAILLWLAGDRFFAAVSAPLSLPRGLSMLILPFFYGKFTVVCHRFANGKMQHFCKCKQAHWHPFVKDKESPLALRFVIN